MCIKLEYESEYGFCFDKFRIDVGWGWGDTIHGYLMDRGIMITNVDEFGREFLDFLERMHEKGLIQPLTDG